MLLKILLCVLVVQIKKIKHTRTHTKFEAGHLTAPNLSSLRNYTKPAIQHPLGTASGV